VLFGLKDDEEKFRLLLKMSNRLKDIEDEMKQNTSSTSSSTMFASSSNFYNTNNNPCNDSYFLNPPQLVNFKAIKEN
jgi:hypothetical protein